MLACPAHTNPSGSGLGTGGILFDKHIDKNRERAYGDGNGKEGGGGEGTEVGMERHAGGGEGVTGRGQRLVK